MSLLLNKELRLATSALAWWFLLFSTMTFLPGYPIAMGAFFICMGLFQSVQKAREANDILFSALLPIAKRDVVTAKFLVTLMFQGLGLAAMIVFALVRNCAWGDAPVYVQNALLPANACFFACVLLIFAAYNVVFLRGFFKTAYYFGKPFVLFIVAAMLVIGVFEVVWHVPGCEFLGAVLPNAGQLLVLAGAVVVFVGATFAALRASQRSFEALDIM